MNKHLKTLLLVSTIVLPLSACGHMHGKDGAMGAKQCKVSKNLEKAQKDIAAVTTNLQVAADEAKDAAAKKNLQKLVKESEKLSGKIGNCKKMCDAKHEKADGTKPAAKSAHKKAHHAAVAKPAAPVAVVPAAKK